MKQHFDKYDFLIVGSGAGGATLAKELSQKGKKILVVERGNNEKKLGTLKAIKFYNSKMLFFPLKSKEGVIIWRTIMAGGSTVVSCGNGLRSSEEILAKYNINLNKEFEEVEKELNINPINISLLSKQTKNIKGFTKNFDYEMQLTPKFINTHLCKKCGNCVFGCPYDAKWTALNFLEEAITNGVDILYNTKVEQVLIKDGKVNGIVAKNPQGRIKILADVVIIAAGGVETPLILKKSGINEAGNNLFVDLFINTYGMIGNEKNYFEPKMTIFNKDRDGFILSPFTQQSLLVRFAELGLKNFYLKNKGLMGIMTKISDENIGKIFNNGKISKGVTDKDQKKLDKGFMLSKEILIRAGAKEKSIVKSKIQGAHPGGTAAIGKVVDKNLQTKIDNLFVCDASVLPESPGMPPILTILALAKRLGKQLI